MTTPNAATEETMFSEGPAVAKSPASKGEYTDCRPATAPLVFDGGYRVSMCYETAEGTIGEARAGIWASGQSGLLWFFDRDNAEVLVKVLNGCSHNGRRWVFVAPVTDVAFNLHVTSSSGRQWTHRNRLGETAATRSDTSAFVCTEDDATSTSVAAGGFPGGRLPENVPAQAIAGGPIARGEYTDCRPATTPLVFDGAYEVSLCYETADGTVGEAQGGIWASNQSGLLWFFSRGNAEVLVKVLDGCSYNGSRWIFVAPVTDVAFNLHVTSVGGREWTHRNRLGETAATASDTSAFDCATEDAQPVPVDIPDANLRRAIEDALGLAGGTAITQLRLEGLTELVARESGISDLTGLESATNLTELHLSANAISDVSPLAGLTNLRSLSLANNAISDVSPLAGLNNLTYLNLGYNEISDAWPLAGLTSLTELYSWNSNMSDASPLAGLANLTRLGLGENEISDVSPLAGLTNLAYLNLWLNEISDVSPLAGLTNLRELNLGLNAISEVSPLAGLNNLTSLGLGGNAISEVSPLAGLTKLTELWLRYNTISEVSPLAGLNNLTRLALSGNAISEVSSLAGLNNLTYLDLWGNAISDASPLAGLTNLRELNLGLNAISEVSPLAGLNNLTSLGLGGNAISDVSPLAGLTKLTTLDLEFNEIADVSALTGLTDLTTLRLRGNPLDRASLDIHIPVLLRRGVEVSFDSFRKGEFDIELVFLGESWSSLGRRQVEWAARRWTAVVSDDLADHTFSEGASGECGESPWEISPGERIDDLRVYVASFEGGPGDPVGYGGPSLFREDGLPTLGCMVLDFERGNIPVLASHELGHVLGLGVGPIWDGFVRTSGDPHFSGPLAVAAFDEAGGANYPGAKVPLRDASDTAHWRVPVLDDELMGPYGGGALSAITVQALADIGHGVDLSQADEYTLPDAVATAGVGEASGPEIWKRWPFTRASRGAGGPGRLGSAGRDVGLLGKEASAREAEPAPFCGVGGAREGVFSSWDR